MKKNITTLTQIISIIIIISASLIPTIQSTHQITNNPPYEPSHPIPEDGATDVGINVRFSWTSGDPDPDDTVIYTICLGTDIHHVDPIAFTSPYPATQQQITFLLDRALAFNTTHYWQILATDNNQNEIASKIWSFTTKDKKNSPPYIPTCPIPTDGATNISINTNLSWIGGDPDGDALVYAVYFGETNPPPYMTSTDMETYNPGTLNYDTTYYWQIIPSDGGFPTPITPIWSFTTEPLYTINVTIIGSGSITGIPDDTVPGGTSIELTAIDSSEGWLFKKWTGDINSEENPLQFIVSKDMQISAIFVETIPDLELVAVNLSANDVKPGSTLKGDIRIENAGDPQSLLDWEVTEYPSWGSWTFSPNNGEDLTPEDSPLTIEVSIEIPDEKNTEYNGTIIISNTEDPEDYIEAEISIATSYNRIFPTKLLDFLIKIVDNFPILKIIFNTLY